VADITEQETTYGLVVSFAGLYPTDAEEHAFVHGVEFGRLWHRMRSGEEAEMEETVHAANRAVIERTCASQGWIAEFRETGEPSWLFVTLRKVKAERRNPHGLRAVK
jgi:hypothetical protein